jgi:hypothetical protein
MDKLKKAVYDLKSFSKNVKSYSKETSFYDEDSTLLGGELKAVVIDVEKEYGLLTHYDNYKSKNNAVALYSFVGNALENGQWSLLDLDSIQGLMNEHFKYLHLKKRFTELFLQSKNTLHYTHEGFHINEFTFETLDEVSRALEQKMFL